MRFAIFGIDDDALRLARYLRETPDHHVSAVCVSPHALGSIRPIAPQAKVVDHWESLLATSDLDAVIVAPDEDQPEVEEPLRKLAQAGIPLLVVHPACGSMVAYELEMIRDDTGSVVFGFFPGRGHPAIAQLAELVRLGDDSPLGRPEQVVIERHLNDRRKETVFKQLTRDIHWIKTLLGELTQVSAIGMIAEDATFSNLAVHFSGAGQLVARWSLGATSRPPAGVVVLSGARGEARLSIPREDQAGTLEIGGDAPRRETFADWDDAQAAIEQFQRELDGAATWPSWDAICQELELAETAQRSLRRRRTIELHGQERSEEAAFKGIMAAGGCTLLLLALALLLVFAVFEGFRVPLVDDPGGGGDQPDRLPLLIRLWPVYPLLAFLLLQLLLLLAKRASRSKPPDPSEDKPA